MRATRPPLLALAALAALAAPASAEGPGVYAALAISASGAYGYSHGYTTNDEARRRALAECVKRTQAGDCKVAAEFNRNCIALAYGTNKVFGWAIGYPNDERPERALNACADAKGQACKVIESFCSGR